MIYFLNQAPMYFSQPLHLTPPTPQVVFSFTHLSLITLVAPLLYKFYTSYFNFITQPPKKKNFFSIQKTKNVIYGSKSCDNLDSCFLSYEDYKGIINNHWKLQPRIRHHMGRWTREDLG